MRRSRSLLAPVALAAGLLALAGCGTDDVVDSTLPAAEVRPIAGPTYVEQVQNGRRPVTVVHTPAHTTRLPGVVDVVWRADGVAVADLGGHARLLDTTTGRWLSRAVPVRDPGITPDALSTLDLAQRLQVTVWDAGLEEQRVVTVPADAIETDQAGPDAGPDAEIALHGRPLTLDGVTWVEWAVNSEDDLRTDHGLLRIDGDRVTEALRNQPLVSVRASRDGAALLAIMQDNGEDQDCGGCSVEQRLVELDPRSGEVAADYGMPPPYTRDWRIGALDKVGGTVVVQFVVREGEFGGAHQTWTYDGAWERLAAAGSTRTRFQEGGAMTWAGDTGEENRPFDLVWRPASGEPQVLRERVEPCPTDDTGWTSCPSIRLPGSLLPPS